jgi:hypothetical protein
VTSGMSAPDWVLKAFPGEGMEYPTDEERDRADGLIAKFNEQWGEEHPPVPRTHPELSDEGFANYLCGYPTNRAYLRSKLRRWWAKR